MFTCRAIHTHKYVYYRQITLVHK